MCRRPKIHQAILLSIPFPPVSLFRRLNTCVLTENSTRQPSFIYIYANCHSKTMKKGNVCEYGLRVEWQVTWKSTDIKRRLWIWNIIFLSFKSLLNCKTCKHCRCAFWFFGFSILYRNYLVWQCGDIAINFDWCDKLGSPILHNANIRIDLRVRTHHLLYVK